MYDKFNTFMILLLGAGAIGQIAWWYPALPEVIPSHFDVAGNVDGEMAKASFCTFIISLHVLCLIIVPFIGILTRFLPDSMVNVPNKEYWLASERRKETIGKASFILNFTGWATSLLLIGLFQLSSLVAINERATINPEFHWLLIFYLSMIFGMVGFVMLKFRIPKEEMQILNKAL